MFSCQKEMDTETDPDIALDTVPEADYEKTLSHTPDGEVYAKTANATVKIDFRGDEYMASHAVEYGHLCIDTVYTRGELIRFYKARRPVFEYGYSSYFAPDDNDYVFPKLEYMLAQECFQDDCSSETRQVVLQLAVDKQKHKYDEYKVSSTAGQTGVFLMAVILIRENDVKFGTAVSNHADLQNALCLNRNIRTDKEFSDLIIQFAGDFLADK
jgi:hypothetical protein